MKQKEFWNTVRGGFLSSPTRIELNKRAKFAWLGSRKESSVIFGKAERWCRATTTRQAAWTYLVKKVKNKVYFTRLQPPGKPCERTCHSPTMLLCFCFAPSRHLSISTILSSYPLKFNPMARAKSTWIQWSGITPS